MRIGFAEAAAPTNSDAAIASAADTSRVRRFPIATPSSRCAPRRPRPRVKSASALIPSTRGRKRLPRRCAPGLRGVHAGVRHELAVEVFLRGRGERLVDADALERDLLGAVDEAEEVE